MKCKKCGAELETGALFCRNCGANVEIIESIPKLPENNLKIKLLTFWRKLDFFVKL